MVVFTIRIARLKTHQKSPRRERERDEEEEVEEERERERERELH